MGPFVKLGPLRDSDIALFAGFLSTIGLIIILTLALTIYGVASFGQENQSHQMKMICKLKSLGSIQRWILLVHAVQDLHLFVCQVFRHSKLNTY
jgi:predicted lysophospholipase L1 biosynthesis ABC-type transport system permease subunit